MADGETEAKEEKLWAQGHPAGKGQRQDWTLGLWESCDGEKGKGGERGQGKGERAAEREGKVGEEQEKDRQTDRQRDTGR